ncbi:hypothetical protein [Campylobacter sp. VTCC 70190]|uniref:hypothetical protein n=1 Tax=Campylobacter sp. VTCC 70190 TaxID=3392118 RepID=UPI00398F68D0
MQENEETRQSQETTQNEEPNTQPIENASEINQDNQESQESEVSQDTQDNQVSENVLNEANTTTELNEEQMLIKMQELLSKNASWLEQVKMSLFAIYHLHKSHKDIKEKYEFVLSECVRIKEELIRSVDEFKIFLDTDKKEFLKMIETMRTLNAENALKVEECKELLKNFENIHELVENTLNSMNEKLQEGKNIHALISAMYEELKRYDAQAIITEANRILEELKQAANDLRVEASQVKDTAITEITELKDNSLSTINETKNTAITEITELKDNSISEITELKDNSLSTINETKNTAITEITELKDNSLSTINETKNTAISEITELKDNSISEISSKKEEALAQIEEIKIEQEQKITELEENNTLQDEKIASLEQAKEELSTELNKKVKFLTQNLTWSVGSGGDYEDLQSAINAASQYINLNNTHITLNIKDGYTLTSPVIIRLNLPLVIRGENGISDTLRVDLNNKAWPSFGLYIESKVNIQDISIESVSVNCLLIYIENTTASLYNVNLTGNAPGIVSTNKADVSIDYTNFNNIFSDPELCYDLSASSSNVVLGGNVVFNTNNQAYATAIRACVGGNISGIWWASQTQIKGNYKVGIQVNNAFVYNANIAMTGNFTSKYSQAPQVLTSNGFISHNI